MTPCRRLHQDRPAFFERVDRLVWPTFDAGTQLRPHPPAGTVLGAVALSGASSKQDLACAEAGLGAIA